MDSNGQTQDNSNLKCPISVRCKNRHIGQKKHNKINSFSNFVRCPIKNTIFKKLR